MPAKEDFIAHNRTTEQIADEIGADRLIYQDLEDLKDACLEGSKTTATDFDSSVFDGTYVTGDVNDQYFARLSLMRGNSADSAKAAVENVGIDLHNESES